MSKRPFLAELDELQQRLLSMGGLVEFAIHRSIRALIAREAVQSREIWQTERRINEMEVEIDELATRILALHQPVARDLRFLTAAIKINSDLERMGDLAINIVQRAVSLARQPQVKPLIDIPHMSQLVENMVHKSLDSFVRRDAQMAESILRADDEVDDLKNSVYRELIGFMENDQARIHPAVDLIFIAHNLERIADHATNIAEDVLFLVNGIDVRHTFPRSPDVTMPDRDSDVIY
ncbi:MAG: Phosphate transport system regulatory protein PhoU [Bryobacterales bacterium]|nr:Phosphate transport system regulatory protein PhoU [Bryobacterales bacterium]